MRVALAAAKVAYFDLRYADALAELAKARVIAVARTDIGSELTCDALEADVAFYEDRFADARTLALRCWDRASPDEPDVALAGALAAHRLADIAVLLGDLDQALVWRTRCRALTEASSRPHRTRVETTNLIETLIARGETRAAAPILAACKRACLSAKDDDMYLHLGETSARLTLFDVLGWGDGHAEPSDVAAVAAWLPPRLLRVEAMGDRWRLTSLLVVAAMLAVATDAPDVDEAVERFARAFVDVPQEEAGTLTAMRRLAERLERDGKPGAARRLDELLEARAHVWRAGFGERDTVP